jgi:hypothetical protein
VSELSRLPEDKHRKLDTRVLLTHMQALWSASTSVQSLQNSRVLRLWRCAAVPSACEGCSVLELDAAARSSPFPDLHLFTVNLNASVVDQIFLFKYFALPF